MARSTSYPSSRVRARSGEIQASDGRGVVFKIYGGSKIQHLIQTHVNMKRVASDISRPSFSIQGSGRLSRQDSFGCIRCVLIVGFDLSISLNLAQVLPRSIRGFHWG